MRSRWSVGVVGSGPAGLAAAEELNAMGHRVVVYERDEGPGGLIRLGVPDFKLEKWIIDRRVALLEQAGIEFEYGVDVGTDLAIDELNARHDAVLLALGSRVERGIDLPGNDLAGIHTAMEYLLQRNRAVAAQPPPEHVITAAGKHVVVIGGGDTAADCVASAHREHAASVTQLDIYPPPAGKRYRELTTWPDFPKRLWSTYALDEGGERRSAFNTTAFEGDGHVRALVGNKGRRPARLRAGRRVARNARGSRPDRDRLHRRRARVGRSARRLAR
jgi:glutamate synthase (NADPH/NADH) small chain